ncbi:MAG: SIR2 family protein [Candidatus Omnitrophica bacterium]|nr:SIR2 family protein [Candidatus Omnitrophota bacterium]
MDKTVYFFGAGATKAIAPLAPLNKDLVKKALEDFDLTPEALRLEGFLKEVFKKRDNPVIDNQVWNLLDYIIQQGKSACKSYNLEEIMELRACLLNLVIQEFQKSLASANSAIYKALIQKISQNATFISTNYDILIDAALVGLIGLNYGAKVRAGVAGEYEDSRNFKRPHSNPILNINTGQIQILKIHGSLNWLYCSKCDEVDATGDKGAVKALSGTYYCHNEHCTCKYEPLLITPTMFKSYENRFIKEVWGYAEKELIAADNLVFIGYALKDEDYQIRCLLMKALLNKEGRYKKVTVIEKEPDSQKEKKQLEENVKKKYEDLYGEVNFQAIGFKKYVDSL